MTSMFTSHSIVIARSEATRQSRASRAIALDCFATLAMTSGEFAL